MSRLDDLGNAAPVITPIVKMQSPVPDPPKGPNAFTEVTIKQLYFFLWKWTAARPVRYPVYYSQPADTNPFQAVGVFRRNRRSSQSKRLRLHATSGKKRARVFDGPKGVLLLV